MEPDAQPSTRRFVLPERSAEPDGDPLMLVDLLGHQAADVDPSDAEGAFEQEIFAGLVTP